MNFQFSDTWLLHSILNTEKENTGANIKDIIAFADYTNHSIMTYEEFAEGIEKLMKANLVVSIGKNYAAGNSFKEWFKGKFNKKIRMNVQKEFNGIANYLETNFIGNEQSISKRPEIVSEEEFRKVISDYFVAA